MRITKTELPNLDQDLQNLNTRKEQLVDEYSKVSLVKSGHLKNMGGARTVEEMQAEMQKLNEEARTLKRQINSIASEKDTARQTISTLDGQLKEHHMKLNELNFKLQQSRTLASRIDECRDNDRRQNSIIDETDSELRQLAPELAKAEAHVRAISRDGAEKENRQQRDASKLAESDMQLKRTEQRIQNYLQRGGPDMLSNCRQDVHSLQAVVKGREDEVASIGEEVNNLEKESTNARATERSIQENLRFRGNKRQLEKLTWEIKDLEGRNTEEERDRFQQDLKILANQHTKLSIEVSANKTAMRVTTLN
jgi:DNA repair protein RAD50